MLAIDLYHYYEFGAHLKHAFEDDLVTELTWPDLVHRIRSGVTVSNWCRHTATAQTPVSANERHRLFLHPDGTITMLDHPGHTNPAGGHSADLDVEAEQFLMALGRPAPACVRMVLWLIGSQLDPAHSLDLAHRLDLTAPTAPGSLTAAAVNARAWYAAVAWAQPPVPHEHPAPGLDGTEHWPAQAWSHYLKPGITPRILAHWVQNGWKTNDALAFLRHGASYETAQQWRLAGQTSARAALQAGRGNTPADDLPWTAVGFTPAESDPWRTTRTWGHGPISPEDAWHLHSHHVAPHSLQEFRSLPTTETEAIEAETYSRRLRSRAGRTFHPDPTLGRALEWTAAGVPSWQILPWVRAIGDSPAALAAALTWVTHIHPRAYPSIEAWNQAHPEALLTVENTTGYLRNHVPADGNLLGPLVAAGVTAREVARPLDMAIHGKRWLGIEARMVLDDAAATTGAPGLSHRLIADAIAKDDWAWVVADMRTPWKRSPLWEHYLSWVCTQPTTPSFTND